MKTLDVIEFLDDPKFTKYNFTIRGVYQVALNPKSNPEYRKLPYYRIKEGKYKQSTVNIPEYLYSELFNGELFIDENEKDILKVECSFLKVVRSSAGNPNWLIIKKGFVAFFAKVTPELLNHIFKYQHFGNKDVNGKLYWELSDYANGRDGNSVE